mmetsp:Transcript_60726/g.130439  ORF Transcript_60726/g.130439 Transcript_60726/m.130439 type:complete len:347 (-) Transcript_60726:96-1136(-)
MSGFDYSKWDKIELSDDEDDVHPNIDKDSWFRLKHRTRVENEEDAEKRRKALSDRLRILRDDLSVYGGAAREHLKAKKIQKEIDEVEKELATMEKERKLNADNICRTVESRTEVSETRSTPKPEPRLQGEAVASGYCEFIEQHEQLLEEYIGMGSAELEEVGEFLKVHGGTLLQGEHAESYLLLDCLEKEMNGQHNDMLRSARQSQLLTQLREFSRASGRPVRDAVHPIFTRLEESEGTKQAFDDSVAEFVRRIEKRAPEKKKEMDAEAAEEGIQEGPGPGGLDPMEVLHSLPRAMKDAFQAQDIQRLEAAIQELSDEDAKYHLKRCEDSGLWVPNHEAGPPPYRQ